MYRIQTQQLLPTVGYSNELPPMLPPWQMGELGLSAPPQVGHLVNNVSWEWFQDVSGRIARQYRRLDVGTCEWVRGVKAKPIMMDERTPLSNVAGAHAWLTALAQQASMDIREAELEVLGGAGARRGICELAGIATLAGAASPRGTGSRLTSLLTALAADLVVRCSDIGSGDVERRVEFVHRRPLQVKSPVDETKALPLAAYVIRFTGIQPEQMIQAVQQSLSSVTNLLGDDGRDTVLVLNPAAR